MSEEKHIPRDFFKREIKPGDIISYATSTGSMYLGIVYRIKIAAKIFRILSYKQVENNPVYSIDIDQVNDTGRVNILTDPFLMELPELDKVIKLKELQLKIRNNDIKDVLAQLDNRRFVDL